MFLRKRVNKMKTNITLYIIAATVIAIAFTGCIATKGSIVILEDINGEGFSAEFNDWSSEEKCDLNLRKNDTIEINISNQDGYISLSVQGENGTEAYKGKDLGSASFTVTITESDVYSIYISGKNASGIIEVIKADD